MTIVFASCARGTEQLVISGFYDGSDRKLGPLKFIETDLLN